MTSESRSCAMSTKKASQLRWLIIGLAIFIAFLNFKPSEPYLSQYLICDLDTELDYCQDFKHFESCSKEPPCVWSEITTVCSVIPCADVPPKLCGNDDFNYCELKDTQCVNTHCYESFSEDEVNNQIYPWSTYAYFPFLLILGPFAELFSYRLAILFGICGRVVTRFLLLFGKSLLSMQLMQVSYALGTAAEDVFSAYIYYVVPPSYYQRATSYVKTAALTSCVVSGVLGDVLVVEFDTSLTVLMWISAGAVCAGFVVGLLVIRRSNKKSRNKRRKGSKQKRQKQSDTSGTSVKRRHSYRSTASSPSEGTSSWLVYLGLASSNTLKLDQPGSKPKTSSFSSTSTFAHSYSRGARLHSAGGRSEGEGSEADLDEEDEEQGEEGEYDEEQEEDEGEEQREENNNIMAAFRNALLNTGTGEQQVQRSSDPSSARGGTGSIARSTVKVFKRQLVYLRRALQSTSLVMLLLMWIVGNAAYTVLYNYEVSIYEELHGSNEWNGCVLAAMLLVGSLGAMLPAWLNHDKMTTRSNEHDQGAASATSTVKQRQQQRQQQPVNDSLLAVRVCTACLLSCASLVLCALFWSTVPSVICLAAFFGTWQYVNVTTFARLALQLKESQTSIERENKSRGGSLVESLLDHSGTTTSASAAAGDNSQHHALSLGAGSQNSTGNFSKFSQYDVVAVSDAFNNITANNNQATSEYIRSRTIDMQAAAAAGEEQGDLLSPLSDSTSPLLPSDDSSQDQATQPPYSIAIVSIVALCVLVQIVIQLVLFSVLELQLRTACLVIILIFVLMTCVYFVYTVALYINKFISTSRDSLGD